MSHPALEKIKDALTETTFCAGIRDITGEQTILYYSLTSSGSLDNQARRIQFSQSTSEELERLTEACQPATFGRNNADVLDESYRKAAKLDKTQFASTFDIRDTDILEIVASELLDASKETRSTIRAELYKLNVYDKGAFFKAHKDTPRAENMFASVVVVFSTPHEGGALLLRHKGQEWTFDSAKEIASSRTSIGYVAFYSDVEHEVTPVVSGHRVTITYNLYLEENPSPEAPTIHADTKPAVRALKSTFAEVLADTSFLPEGGRLGFNLSHQYPFLNALAGDNHWNPGSLDRIIPLLKGVDHALYRVCRELSLHTTLCIVYQTDDDTLLSKEIINLGGDEVEGNMSGHLQEYYDVEALESGSDDVEKANGGALEWVTQLENSYNRVKTDYMAYGNEAYSAYLYGNMCLIVKVGDTENRETTSNSG